MTDARRPRAVRPGTLSDNVHLLSRSLRPGRMEDAHEFLSSLLTAFARAVTLGCARSGPAGAVLSAAQEMRSPVRRVFGGITQSSVTCEDCKHVSAREEPFTELPLDIHRARSVAQALHQFSSVEYLKGANKYFCDMCKRKVCATIRLSLLKAPNALVLVLKRFIGSGKSNKFVEYPATLDLSSHMPAVPDGVQVKYNLSGVLVHSGGSCRSGHYFAFVKSPNGVWRKKDDGHQSIVGESYALDQKAYILFYTRCGERPNRPRARVAPVSAAEQNGESDASQTTNPDIPMNSRSSSPSDPLSERRENKRVLCQDSLDKKSIVAKSPSVVRGTETASHTKLVTPLSSKLSAPVPPKMPASSSSSERPKTFSELATKMSPGLPTTTSLGATTKTTAQVPTPVSSGTSTPSKVSPTSKLATPTPSQLVTMTSSKMTSATAPDQLSTLMPPHIDDEQGLCAPYSLGLAAKNIPEVVSGIRTLMVIGVETAKRAVYRAFRADHAPIARESTETAPEEAPVRATLETFQVAERPRTQQRTYRRPGSRSASALFGEQGVEVWGEEKDKRAAPSQTGAIEKRKRAHDELDAEYDAGKAKKVRKKVTVNKMAFQEFAQKKTASACIRAAGI